MLEMSIHTIFAVAAALRVLFICYGSFHDRIFEVKFTDIDYSVFSDAAYHVLNGGSPYQRESYRYPPVLAWLLVPNHLAFYSFGKVLFCIVDMIAGYVLVLILKHRGSTRVELALLAWLVSPFNIVISTRGSCDSIQVLLVLGTIYCLYRRWPVLAGLLHGLSVHFRIYSIIYTLPYCLMISRWRETSNKTLLGVFKSTLLSPCVWTFLTATLGSTIALNGVAFWLYGFPFLNETYLYHVMRTDIRHNFSVFFYPLLLLGSSPWTSVVSALAFGPQLLSSLLVSWYYYEELPFCLLLQTFLFVTFNKVCTSQYFVWYLALVPLAMDSMRMELRAFLGLLFTWLLSQAVWLFQAYRFEFLGKDNLVQVWLASVLFFVTNLFISLKMVQARRARQLEPARKNKDN